MKYIQFKKISFGQKSPCILRAFVPRGVFFAIQRGGGFPKEIFLQEEDIKRGVLYLEEEYSKRGFLRGRPKNCKEEFYLCQLLISIPSINR